MEEKQKQDFTKHLQKLTSYKHEFGRGIVKGIGFAIGATIIGTVIFSILAQTIQTLELEDVPILNEVVTELEQ